MKQLKLAQKCSDDFWRFQYLPSNGLVENNIYTYDNDLLFERQSSLNLCELTPKKLAMTFDNFYICHRMASLQKLNSWPWHTFGRFTFSILVWLEVRDGAKVHELQLLMLMFSIEWPHCEQLFYTPLTYFMNTYTLKC